MRNIYFFAKSLNVVHKKTYERSFSNIFLTIKVGPLKLPKNNPSCIHRALHS
jgi:hypothetical protein